MHNFQMGLHISSNNDKIIDDDEIDLDSNDYGAEKLFSQCSH